MTTLNESLELIQLNKRICPQPQVWQALYKLLPDKKHVGSSFEPSAPLILAAWWVSSEQQKIMRLQEHIEWASDHGCLDRVHKFLSDLPESDWFHIDE